ncbi:hypothetical protein R1sor_010088 [Riccia sorocarpa]|uniref:DUF659 domain-containing protein n=1 Tax=Riccia sorocarpa TaxID=122646 RepID=A0ABD3I0N0_9MARC
MDYHNMEQQRDVDKKWAMAVYELGLPFNIFMHKVFKEAYEFSKHLPGYVLPELKKLSNDLLDDEFKEVKDRTEKLMFPPLGFSKVTLTCDGWTNIQGRPIVNFLIVNKYGEMYHSSVDCSGIYKDAIWESGELIKVIEELRPENVFQFVADNAPVNRKAGELIREKYPHIVFGGCVAHGLNLLCATRFMTNFIMIDRAYALRYCLKKMTSSKEWEKYEGGITDWTTNDIVKKMHTNVKLKSRLLTQKRYETISINAHARWKMWNNELHPTAMLLMPFYFTKPTALPYLQIEHMKQSFRRYLRKYGTHVFKKQLDKIEEYVEKCMDDLTLVLGGNHQIINHENSVKLAEKLLKKIYPKKFEDDIDDDDLCSEEGDGEFEDDCLMDVLLRSKVRFDMEVQL